MPHGDTHAIPLTAAMIVRRHDATSTLLRDLSADWRRWTRAERVGAGIAVAVAMLIPLSVIAASTQLVP